MSLARQMNCPLMVAFASTTLGMVLLLRREHGRCADLVSEQIHYCSEQGFIFWWAACDILHGAARAGLDGDPAGVAQVETGIQNRRKTGAALHTPTWSSYLAEAALVAGDLDRAESALSDGIATSARHGDVFALAELQRLTGRLRLRQQRRSEAGRAFEEAVATARRQDAGWYLLRAGRDLARLIADDGDARGARDVLKPIVELDLGASSGLGFPGSLGASGRPGVTGLQSGGRASIMVGERRLMGRCIATVRRFNAWRTGFDLPPRSLGHSSFSSRP